MFDRLDDLLIRYQQVMEELGDPEVANDQTRFRKLMKEQSELSPIAEKYTEYKQTKKNIDDSLELLETENDEEMRELAKEELAQSKEDLVQIEQELKILLLPKDRWMIRMLSLKSVPAPAVMKQRCLRQIFFRMYSKYAESRRWKVEVTSVNENGLGGFKEIIFMINGQGAYSRLKYESGVHRVQRVPETEASGRIHTSTATVAIMPEAEDVDVQLDMNDVPHRCVPRFRQRRTVRQHNRFGCAYYPYPDRHCRILSG